MRSPVADVLAALRDVLEPLGIRHYLFGAQAAILHGSPRTTADVDVTALLGSVRLEDLLTEVANGGFAVRVNDPRQFAERTRVVPLLHHRTAIPVDLVLAGSPLEEEFLSRARLMKVEGVPVRVATAEDVVIMKILAGRGKDIDDARAVLTARSGSIDLGRIRSLLAMLDEALDRSDLVPMLERLLSSLK